MALEFLAEIRYGVYAYFLSLRVEYHDDVEGDEGGDGIRRRTAFRMQHDGEVDVRATYCVMAPCYLLGLLDNDDDDDDDDDDGNPLLSPSVSNFVASCQTYEGGFGAEPHNEAHGGYAFCAIASLRLLLHRRGCGGRRKLRQQLGGRSLGDVIDVDALSSWLARRQMGYEGGFSGRTNKLVDGCYSFWQGGATAVLDGYLGEDGRDVDGDGDDDNCEKRSDRRSPTFDEWMLQRYILLCAQDVNGGLRDKPSKGRDFYHSCYNLSGLSVAQHALGPWPPTSGANRLFGEDDACGDEEAEEEDDMVEEGKLDERLNRLFGDASVNVVGTTDPVINIRVERVKFMLSRKY
jgi:protein farnesyltransferase subunit beta